MQFDRSDYHPTHPNHWQGRKDSLPLERYFQRVKILDLHHEPIPEKSDHTMIIGFCSDEGVRRNEGRVGASEAPNIIRQQLGKLASHQEKQYIDLGNIICHGGDLEKAQSQLAQLVNACHAKGFKTIVLGGGHEVAWGHFSGLSPHYKNLGIINFDAHFDLRPILPDHLGNSGTPFWQIAEYSKKAEKPFHYCCIGIQELANTNSLFANAQTYHVPYLTTNQMNVMALPEQVAFLNDFIAKTEKIYLTVCLDVFNEAVAPGVSAPQALGLFPNQAIPLLKSILQTGKVVSIDLAELSPPLDQGQKTSRFAAALLATLMECF